MGYIPRRLRGPRERPSRRDRQIKMGTAFYESLGNEQRMKAIPLEPPMTETVKRPASGSWRSLWR